MKNDWPIVTYEQSRSKSAQNMLYEAAYARDAKIAEKKWKKFVEQINSEHLSDEQIKILIHNLDGRKQWAAIHYAVDADNIYVFNQLTACDKLYRCNINIHGGNGETVLHIAARSHQIWENKGKNSDENSSQASMMVTAYHIKLPVAESNLPKIVSRILELGPEINERDNEGRTPLHFAVLANRYYYAKELIAQKANIMATTKLKTSVLYFALLPNGAKETEFNDMVNLILCSVNESETNKLINLATLDNETPLARALCHPLVKKELIERLLNNNDDINVRQLLVAFNMVAQCRKDIDQSFEYLKPLIDRLKNLEQGDNSQLTSSQLPHIICRHDNKPLLKWFYQYMNKVNVPNMNKDDYNGYTPLLTAVFYNSKECVQLLLEQTESIDCQRNLRAVNKDQENILHICAKRQIKEDLFSMIWKNLSDTYDTKGELMAMMDAEENVPLEVAAQFGNENMCRILLDYVKKKSPREEAHRLVGRAAHKASEAGHLEILKLIIRSGFNTHETQKVLQMQDEYGYTCLHLAAAQGQEAIVEFLIDEMKADVDVIGDRRQTPLQQACENGHIKVVQLLLKAGASTTLRNAQIYNCLEIAIVNQRKDIVQGLREHSLWREMMRNAQPIEGTEAFDTPMRKLIRYIPDMAIWLIKNKFTQIVGGPGQKIYKTTYDYEFYEDMHKVIDWYTQGADSKLVLEPITFKSLWHNRGVEAIHTCWCCCHSNDLGCRYCCTRKKTLEEECYTNDAYTLVRNHPLFIVSQQWHSPELVEHFYHTHLRQTKLRSFGLVFFILSYFFYMTYLGLFTSIVLMGKHPKFFYDEAGVNMTLDLPTCEYVANFLTNNPTITSEVFKTDTYKRIKWSLYAILSIFIIKNLITITALFPKVLRVGGSYIEISALILSYVYVLDWFDWQTNVMFRCPVQYQLGAMGILLSYINLLVYLRTSPIFDIGIYVVMLQVMSAKFLRFLSILLVIICGFGFTYWMLLQYQTVYGTPIEALMRTALMLFDLGYEDRLYGDKPDDQGYYKLVYVIFMLTAIACSIFVINLLIGLAVGEIPTLLTQGTLWRIQMLYSLLSDYEILRIRITLFFDFLTCNIFRDRQIPWFRSRPYSILQKDELASPMGKIGALWNYTEKHFFHEQIQDNIDISTGSNF